MTTKFAYLGALEATSYDSEGRYSDGQPLEGARFDGNIRLDAPATKSYHAVRKAEWDMSKITWLAVADIDNPSAELALYSPAEYGFILCYEVSELYRVTLYAGRAESQEEANPPYVVEGAVGRWFAIGGAYSYRGAGLGTPVELEAPYGELTIESRVTGETGFRVGATSDGKILWQSGGGGSKSAYTGRIYAAGTSLSLWASSVLRMESKVRFDDDVWFNAVPYVDPQTTPGTRVIFQGALATQRPVFHVRSVLDEATGATFRAAMDPHGALYWKYGGGGSLPDDWDAKLYPTVNEVSTKIMRLRGLPLVIDAGLVVQGPCYLAQGVNGGLLVDYPFGLDTLTLSQDQTVALKYCGAISQGVQPKRMGYFRAIHARFDHAYGGSPPDAVISIDLCADDKVVSSYQLTAEDFADSSVQYEIPFDGGADYFRPDQETGRLPKLSVQVRNIRGPQVTVTNVALTMRILETGLDFQSGSFMPTFE